ISRQRLPADFTRASMTRSPTSLLPIAPWQECRSHRAPAGRLFIPSRCLPWPMVWTPTMSEKAMKRVTPDEIVDIAQYEKKREAFRTEVIALKKRRRIPVGPQITFVFENHETVLFQIQEMMRAERIVEEKAIQHELETYNALLADSGGLGATMLIELTDSSRIREDMDKLLGVNDGRVTYLL